MTAIKNYLKEQSAPKSVSTKVREDQVENNTGGFVFKTSDEQRLTRFLVLGSDGGTYYATERDLTSQSVDFIIDFIKRDEATVRETVVDVSANARAPKNSSALFVLALLFVYGEDKAMATDALLDVARTGTHLFEFVSYLKGLGGLGKAKRRAIGAWYLNKNVDRLGMQVAKYRSRYGYTHRDLLRLCHVKGLDQSVGEFILNGKVTEDAPGILHAFEEAQAVTSAAEAVKVIKRYPLVPWEFFPTEVHKSKDFWKAIFETGTMGQTALLRNVTRFAKLGLFDDVKFAGDVAKALSDPEAIKRGRLHPVQYLNALGIYSNGTFERGGYGRSSVPYAVNAKISGALEKGFYAAFANVEPSGKRTMVSLDVSGSMTWEAPAGLVGINAMEAAAAMAMVTVRTEDYVEVNAFSSDLQKVDISDSDSLYDVNRKLNRLGFGCTNIAAPIEQALSKRQVIDTFIIYTDNEVNSGRHAYQVLDEYRRKVNPQARLVIVGMTVTNFTVARPDDPLSLDVVGFDAAAPGVIADFSAGRL